MNGTCFFSFSMLTNFLWIAMNSIIKFDQTLKDLVAMGLKNNFTGGPYLKNMKMELNLQKNMPSIITKMHIYPQKDKNIIATFLQ